MDHYFSEIKTNNNNINTNITGTSTDIPEEPSTEACMPNHYSVVDQLSIDDNFGQINSMTEEGLATVAASMPNHDRGRMSNRPNGYSASNDIASTLFKITFGLTLPNIIILGVYGSSNAKKDTVLEKITRRVKRDNLFDLTVRASVMKKPDLKRIQEELGNMLNLQICEKTLEGRARILFDRIKNVGRILVILDDVWGQVNLNQIGIPFGDNHSGCKILLISETQDVLSNQTDTQIKFTV